MTLIPVLFLRLCGCFPLLLSLLLSLSCVNVCLHLLRTLSLPDKFQSRVAACRSTHRQVFSDAVGDVFTSKILQHELWTDRYDLLKGM